MVFHKVRRLSAAGVQARRRNRDLIGNYPQQPVYSLTLQAIFRKRRLFWQAWPALIFPCQGGLIKK
jgi:hypothetical protein